MPIHKLALLTICLLLALPSLALDKAHIQLSAQGSIEVMPDFIRIDIDIEKTGNNKAGIKAEVDRIAGQVLAASRKLGIKEPHIDASQLTMQPQYEWHNNKRRLIGETVRRNISIKLYDLQQYSALAEAMAALDINRMQQQGFGFDKPEQHQHQALAKALTNGRNKAELMAATLGRKLGAVYHVNESGHSTPPPMPMRAMAMMEDSSASAPLEIRPQTISSTVSMIYLLLD